jgi:hypothetical protein
MRLPPKRPLREWGGAFAADQAAFYNTATEVAAAAAQGGADAAAGIAGGELAAVEAAEMATVEASEAAAIGASEAAAVGVSEAAAVRVTEAAVGVAEVATGFLEGLFAPLLGLIGLK